VNQTLEYGLPAKAARKTACWSCTVVQLCARTRRYASCFSVASFRYESFHLQINPAIAAVADTLAEPVAEPVQGLVTIAADEDASQQQAEERPAVAEHELPR